jgi:hypothetical protein
MATWVMQTNSAAFSPQVNYINWTTAICWRISVPAFVDKGVSRGQRDGIPTAINLSFLVWSRYFLIRWSQGPGKIVQVVYIVQKINCNANIDMFIAFFLFLQASEYIQIALHQYHNFSWLVTFITTKLLDFVHRPDFYKQKTQRFGNWICFRLQAGGGRHLLYRKTKSLPFHRRCQNKCIGNF